MKIDPFIAGMFYGVFLTILGTFLAIGLARGTW